MKINLEILDASRDKLDKIIGELSKEKLFEIPNGFKNNIIWHIGHCVVSQQRLIYMRSCLPMNISDEFNDLFKIGTTPLDWKIEPDINDLKKSLKETVDKLRIDLDNKIFKSYEPIKSSMGFIINNHLDALTYTNFHEAEHTGNIQYLIKIISGK